MATGRLRAQYDGSKVVEDLVTQGWEIRDLARASGLHEMTIRRFIQGHPQTTKTATAIARAFGFKPRRYFLGVRTEAA